MSDYLSLSAAVRELPCASDAHTPEQLREADVIVARDLETDHEQMLWGMRVVMHYEEHGTWPNCFRMRVIGYRGAAQLAAIRGRIRSAMGRRFTRVDAEAMDAGRTLEECIAAVDRRDADRDRSTHRNQRRRRSAFPPAAQPRRKPRT